MTKELLELAKQIYVLKVVTYSDWDLQKVARESLNMATQFFLAVPSEPGPGSTAGAVAEPAGSLPASQSSTAPADTSSSPPLPPPGSTTGIAAGRSIPGSTAAGTVATGPGMAPGAGKDLRKTPPPDQSVALSRSVQETPYPPYQKHQ